MSALKVRMSILHSDKISDLLSKEDLVSYNEVTLSVVAYFQDNLVSMKAFKRRLRDIDSLTSTPAARAGSDEELKQETEAVQAVQRTADELRRAVELELDRMRAVQQQPSHILRSFCNILRLFIEQNKHLQDAVTNVRLSISFAEKTNIGSYFADALIASGGLVMAALIHPSTLLVTVPAAIRTTSSAYFESCTVDESKRALRDIGRILEETVRLLVDLYLHTSELRTMAMDGRFSQLEQIEMNELADKVIALCNDGYQVMLPSPSPYQAPHPASQATPVSNKELSRALVTVDPNHFSATGKRGRDSESDEATSSRRQRLHEPALKKQSHSQQQSGPEMQEPEL